MALLHKYNFDDVFIRAISLSLLDLLNNKLSIWNRITDTEYQDILIPFFYDAHGDERFMQDFYMNDTLDDCVDAPKVEANIDVVPRGHISFSDMTITTASLSNRFVRGDYRREDDQGRLLTHNAPINYIPIQLDFDCVILVDTELNLFKILQKIIEVFYKSHVIVIRYDGFVIKAEVSFPENENLEIPKEYTYGDNVEKKITFRLEVDSYYPVIDTTQDFLKSQQIESFTSSFDAESLFLKTSNYAFNDIERDINSDRIIKETDKEGVDYIRLPLNDKRIG